MMISHHSITSLLLASSVLFLSFSRGAEAEECDSTSETATVCAAENRDCVLTTSTGEEACGDCLDGFIEWQGRTRDVPICFNISAIQFQDFLDAYEPTYKTDLPNGERLQILLQSIETILQSRAANNGTKPAFELGLTPFSADSAEEFKQRSGYLFQDVQGTEDELPMVQSPSEDSLASLPASIDWVAEGAVTSVKDQGRCGCCWSVSLAGAIEGSAFIQNGYLQSVSFQQYISCNDENLGCDGGNLVIGMGYAWLNDFGGMTILNDYPFTDYDGTTTTECSLDGKSRDVEVKDPKVAFDTATPVQFDERLNLVKSVLAKQPISMIMKSSCSTFSNYKKGILTDDGECACNSADCADHAVLMVGYDDTTDPPSIKLKNSWGTSWGEDGYFLVSQQETGRYGLFGILSHGVIPGMVTNTTAAVVDEKQDKKMQPWAIVLIVIACLVVCGGLAKAATGGGGGDQSDSPGQD
jgi:C1A family cysteine protease